MLTFTITHNETDISVSFTAERRISYLVRLQTGPAQVYDQSELQNIINVKNKLLQIGFDYVNDQILKHMPSTPLTIVDIGCGVGILDMMLYKHLNNGSKFYMFDGENTRTKAVPIYDSSSDTINEDRAILDGISTNNFDQDDFIIRDPRVPGAWDGIQADIVMTHGSWGLHYPLDTYLEQVDTILKPGGYLLVIPYLNVNNAFNTLCQRFGQPIYHESAALADILKHLTPEETARWTGIRDQYRPGDECKDWTLKSVFQKPIT